MPIKANSKYPLTKNGMKDATNDPQQLADWFNTGKHVNMAVNCEKSGLIVIDCDVDPARNYNGIDKLEQMEEELGELPVTVTVRTPRGGLHLYFKAPKDIVPKGKLADDIDIKYKGYVLCTPSIIKNAPIKGMYLHLEGLSHYEIEPAQLPVAWIDKISTTNLVNNKETKKYYSKSASNIKIEKLYNECLFIKDCIDNASTLSYHQWFSFSAILAQIKDGRSLFHFYSSPHPSYSFEQTEKMFNNSVAFGRPHTCIYIRSITNACNSCTKGKEQ